MHLDVVSLPRSHASLRLLANKRRPASVCEYNRSCADEIDFASAEQMHAAALQISKTCFDLKKLCVTFLGVSMVFLIVSASIKMP